MVTAVSTEAGVTCRLTEIFRLQRQLIEKFHPVEKLNGMVFYDQIPVDLDNRYAQARLKDFAWRVTEELAEACQALDDHRGLTDFYVELIDVLHFLVELSIVAGLTPEMLGRGKHEDVLEDLYEANFSWYYANGSNYEKEHGFLAHSLTSGEIRSRVMVVVQRLGMTMNQLKNKPWKQSFKPTDLEKFNAYLAATWDAFITLLGFVDLTPENIYAIYQGKHQVNQTRHATGV